MVERLKTYIKKCYKSCCMAQDYARAHHAWGQAYGALMFAEIPEVTEWYETEMYNKFYYECLSKGE